jgi:hypothetical protein
MASKVAICVSQNSWVWQEFKNAWQTTKAQNAKVEKGQHGTASPRGWVAPIVYVCVLLLVRGEAPRRFAEELQVPHERPGGGNHVRPLGHLGSVERQELVQEEEKALSLPPP